MLFNKTVQEACLNTWAPHFPVLRELEAEIHNEDKLDVLKTIDIYKDLIL